MGGNRRPFGQPVIDSNTDSRRWVPDRYSAGLRQEILGRVFRADTRFNRMTRQMHLLLSERQGISGCNFDLSQIAQRLMLQMHLMETALR